jgi:hypothetical protein
VIDLREAVRNLARIETQLNEKKADLLLALGSKALLNGATVNRWNYPRLGRQDGV